MQLLHENNLEILRQKAMLLQRENDLLHARLQELAAALDKARGQDSATLQQELALLHEKLAAHQKALFGKSSEKRPQPQPENEAPKPEPKPQRGHGPRPQPKLPVIEQVHEIAVGAAPCNVCGAQMRPMDGQFEEHDEVDVVERTFRIVRHKRQKYRCNCQACIVTAPGPQKLLEGGRYSTAFAVEVAHDKFGLHAPLTRQVDEMRQQGLDVTSQALWDQTDRVAELLEPAYLALRLWVLGVLVIGADETRWPMLDGSGKTWWAWAAASERGVWYRIAKSRSHEEAGRLLGDFSGTVVTDAYSAYDALRKERLRRGQLAFKNPHCWAHCRRKYVAAEPHHPEAAGVLALIGKLYAIEAAARKAHPDDDAAWLAHLAAQRQTASAAVLAEIRAWRQAVRVLPKSSLGRAIAYMDDNWQQLQYFVADPQIPLDNNEAERGMRRLAVGRKNHYGSKSLRGTQVAALFYSLIETARLVGVDPKAYLLAATRRALADPKSALLPHQFATELAADTG